MISEELKVIIGKLNEQGKMAFLDAYGRDKTDESILKIVAATEVFG